MWKRSGTTAFSGSAHIRRSAGPAFSQREPQFIVVILVIIEDTVGIAVDYRAELKFNPVFKICEVDRIDQEAVGIPYFVEDPDLGVGCVFQPVVQEFHIMA